MAPEPELQDVVAPLTSNAVFLVVTVNPGDRAAARVRDLGADLAGLVRGVGFRDLRGGLSCVIGLGAQLWDRISPGARPAELHPFQAISGVHHAVATPGDLLFHIRATRMDLCFELATQIMIKLDGAVTPVEEVHGFRYFEERDLLGFVDGTENPTGRALAHAVVIGPEDPDFAGGSYVVVQKYLHDMTAWNALSTEDQERVIGRTKLGNIEIDEDVRPTSAHNSLTTIEHDGREVKIARDNMPFGNAANGEFGTYFIGYARSPSTVEEMLTNMFVGRPPGNYDRLLDFSRAVTGCLFFVPSVTLLESLAD
jgi:putative iron-dependent peroxidase